MRLDSRGRPSGCDSVPGAGSRLWRLPRSLAVGVCFLLAGCGTNIPGPIEELETCGTAQTHYRQTLAEHANGATN